MGDPMTHLLHKCLAEQLRRASTPATQTPINPNATGPPPPYDQAITNLDSDSDSESDSSEPEEPSQTPPLKLTINAANRIKGNNNLIPTSISPLADAARLSQILLLLLSNHASGGRGGGGIDLTINCGITVVGDRNVVGQVGLRAKAGLAAGIPLVPEGGAAAGGGDGAVAGAKRKAREDVAGAEPPLKKVASEDVGA